MTLTLSTYLIYILLSLLLTIFVGNILGKTGKAFFKDYFQGNENLAENINRLALLGFYLLNIGYISLTAHSGIAIRDYEHMFEVLSYKIGINLLVLAGFYLFDLWMMLRMRNRKKHLEDYIRLAE
ncbi:MAG: hypothetical protein AAGD28_03630 [Bacteroidota bacterium]